MKRRVVAFGSFDVLHPGHIKYLQGARALGTELVVVVARDSSILMFKKKRPLFNERDRLAMVSSLGLVDKAVLGNRIATKAGIYGILSRLKPDVIAIGYDQADVKELKSRLKDMGIKARVAAIKGYRTKRYKSSRIKQKLGLY
ncbi:MAG: FAD synthase [Candidatus Micrarchaeota archaeon]|nr:FAD synthase [Candidatus Micrarchaeota archaeon]MDE1823735.1 FAD synthase [Candidatus Micrarchaeota archaeon]MDE1849209.1 FAD synthase [Candidatus Micrarchaeota archaeon]